MAIQQYLTLKLWLAGLLHATISGAATSCLALWADPVHFDFSVAGLTALGKMAIGGALLGLWAYLRQSPLPWDGATERRNRNGGDQTST